MFYRGGLWGDGGVMVGRCSDEWRGRGSFQQMYDCDDHSILSSFPSFMYSIIFSFTFRIPIVFFLPYCSEFIHPYHASANAFSSLLLLTKTSLLHTLTLKIRVYPVLISVFKDAIIFLSTSCISISLGIFYFSFFYIFYFSIRA